MPNPATPPITGYDGPAYTQTQQYWLDVAWRALQGEVPGIATRVAADPEYAQLAADVVTAAARRVLRNPDGFESESGQVDDYQESWKRSDATEDVYFTAAELRRLQDPAASSADWSGSAKYA